MKVWLRMVVAALAIHGVAACGRSRVSAAPAPVVKKQAPDNPLTDLAGCAASEPLRSACAQISRGDFRQARACGMAAQKAGCSHAITGGGDERAFARATALFLQGDRTGAAKLLDPLLERGVTSVEILTLHGALLRERGDFAASFAALVRAFALDSKYPPARANLLRLFTDRRVLQPVSQAVAQLRASGLAELTTARLGAELAIALTAVPRGEEPPGYDRLAPLLEAQVMLAALPGQGPEVAALQSRLEVYLARLLIEQESLGKAREALDAAEQSAIRSGDPLLLSLAQVTRGDWHLALGGEHEAAGVKLLESVIAYGDLRARPQVEAAVVRLMGWWRKHGDPSRAQATVALCLQRGDAALARQCQEAMCKVLTSHRRFREATACWSAFAQQEEPRDLEAAAKAYGEGVSTCHWARSSQRQTQSENCRPVEEKALALLQRIPPAPWTLDLIAELGREKELEAALQRLAPQLDALAPQEQSDYLHHRAALADRPGNEEAAVSAYLAEATGYERWSPRLSAHPLADAARLLVRLGRPREALALGLQARHLFHEGWGPGAGQRDPTYPIGRAYQLLGQLGKAREELQLGLGLHQNPALRIVLLGHLCEVQVSLGQFTDALRSCQEAHGLMDSANGQWRGITRHLLALQWLVDRPPPLSGVARNRRSPEVERLARLLGTPQVDPEELAIAELSMFRQEDAARLLRERAQRLPPGSSERVDGLLQAMRLYLAVGMLPESRALRAELDQQPEPLPSLAAAQHLLSGAEPSWSAAAGPLERALAFYRAGKREGFGVLAAQAALALGRFSEAAALAERERGGVNRSAAGLLKGLALLHQGDYPASVQTLLSVMKEPYTPSAALVARTARGILAALQGDVEVAAEEVSAARSPGSQRSDPLQALRLLMRAITLTDPSALQAQMTQARTSAWPFELPLALATQGLYLAFHHQEQQARPVLEQALRLLRSPGAGVFTPDIARVLALAAAGAGHCDLARQAQAEVAQPAGSRWAHIFMEGAASACQPRPPSGADFLAAVRSNGSVAAGSVAIGLLALKQAHERRGDSLAALETLEAATQVLRTPLPGVSEAQRSPPVALARRFAADAIELLLGARSRTGPSWRALVTRVLAVESQLREVAAGLSTPAVTHSYVPALDEGLWLFRATASGMLWIEWPGDGPPRIERLPWQRDPFAQIEAVLAAIRDKRPAELATQLAALPPPLSGARSAALRGKRRWLILPDGPLWRFPFALTAAKAQPAPAQVILFSLLQGADAEQAPPPEPLLAVGDPEFYGPSPLRQHGEARSHYAALSKSPEEIDGALAVFYKGTPHPEARVTRARARADIVSQLPLDRYRYLLFSTHSDAAIPRWLGPPAPGLVFSYQPQKGEFSLLLDTDIRRMQLRADLVVLPTCNSAVAAAPREQDAMLPGSEERGIGGLAGAFLQAGARAVVAMLWRFQDDQGPIVVKELFTKLHDGQLPAQAVEAARNAARRGARPEELDWAGLVLWQQRP